MPTLTLRQLVSEQTRPLVTPLIQVRALIQPNVA